MKNFIIDDYGDFKLENMELMKSLENTTISSRFSHVFKVLDYIYNMYLSDEEIDDDLMNIFTCGFYYIFDCYFNIKIILDTYCDSSVEELIKIEKTVILYLYVQDFILEMKDDENYNESDLKKLEEFSDKVMKLIENKQNCEDYYFAMLDDLTVPILKDYQSTLQIFYEIYEDLDLDVEEDEL